MNELKELLARQARWQKEQRALTWPEKIRLAEQIRAWAKRWRSLGAKENAPHRKSESPKP
ncbi:MAG TPA: hypothetical protein VNK82_09115 [Terriglobales bacterium]|nr:hypothetical protein [Terriglobales bacterium]